MTDIMHADTCEADERTIAQLDEVRQSGECNMMDYQCVHVYAIGARLNALTSWCGCMSTLGKTKRAAAWMDALKRL